MYELGDDVYNNVLGVMGSFRAIVDGIVLVRTASGLEKWPAADCSRA
jgi:hypothetical protein